MRRIPRVMSDVIKSSYSPSKAWKLTVIINRGWRRPLFNSDCNFMVIMTWCKVIFMKSSFAAVYASKRNVIVTMLRYTSVYMYNGRGAMGQTIPPWRGQNYKKKVITSYISLRRWRDPHFAPPPPSPPWPNPWYSTAQIMMFIEQDEAVMTKCDNVHAFPWHALNAFSLQI